jgi:hypothetical protein
MTAGDKCLPILVDESDNTFGQRHTDGAIHVVLTTGAGGKITNETEGEESIYVVPGYDDGFAATLVMQTINATTAFMAVDLSDTGSWPHTNTDHIDIKYAALNVNPSSAFRGDIILGYLSNVGGSDGTLIELERVHFEQQSSAILDLQRDYQFADLEAKEERHYGPRTNSLAIFGTGIALKGPEGLATHTPGDGDVVIYIDVTAGSVDATCLIGYKARTS